MTEQLSSPVHHRSSVDHLFSDSLRSPNRSVTGHSDSGISNGFSVSSGPRYKADSSLDRGRHDYGHLDTYSEQYSSPSRRANLSVNDNYSSPHHRLNNSRCSVDHCSTGRSQSMTHLNVLNSQDWRSPSSGSPSRYSSKTHTGASLHDASRPSPQRHEVDGLNQALEDSEGRRHLLVERLRDAQETIKFQAQKLSEIENSARDTSVSVDDLRFKEKELTKKISMLEREKNSYYEKHMESLKSREQLQLRIETLSTEVASLRTTMELVQSDVTRKDKTISQLTGSVNELEENNDKLTKSKDALLKELDSVRQSLDLCRSHSEYLEGQNREYRTDSDKLREENQSLILEKRTFSQKISALETKNYSLNEDHKSLLEKLQKLTDEKHQLVKQLGVLQDTVTDLKGTLAVTAADKERFFQEKLELSNQIQKNLYEKENWEKLRCSLEEQISELTAEVVQMRQEADKFSDERRRHEDDMSTVKQVSDVMSAELSKVKTQLEKNLERCRSLEQTKMMALKQHELYEQEIQSLETQLRHHKESLASQKAEHQKDKEAMEQYKMKVKDELRELKSERNQLEARCHEAEAKLHQAEQNLSLYSDEQQTELEKWRSQCEKATSLNNHQHMEIEVLNQRVQDLEDQVEYLKVNHDVYQTQFEELTEARCEIKRLQEENRRFLQERAENQQVIQLLQMQKDILAKTNEDSLSKGKDIEQLQYTVEQLTVEKQQLQERLTELEHKEKERMRENNARDNHNEPRDLPEPIKEQISELEARNKQLKEFYTKVAEKLTAAEQENSSLQTRYRDCVSRSEYRSLERSNDQLQNTVSQLEEQLSMVKHQNEQLLENHNKKMVDSQDMWVIQKQKEDLENRVSVLSGQVTVLEDQKQDADNRNTQLQKQLDAVHEKLFNLCHEDNSRVVSLEKQVKQLTAELDNARRQQDSQDNTIQSLKEELEDEKTKKPSKLTQSLDAVGEDLTAVRTELHKLGDIIQGKDLQIDDLERQLGQVRKQLTDKEKQIEMLTTGTGSGKEENDKNDYQYTGTKTIQRQLEERVEELEDEKDELSEQAVQLRRQCDLARVDVEDLKEALEDLKKTCENEHIKTLEKLRKDIAAKDRQIECLEEQLRRHTNVEIKKLKRGASKVELLKAENRRLQSQLSSPAALTPRFSEQSSSQLPSPSKPSCIGMRLGERLHGNVASTSPSQRLLSRLYGDDYSKEAVLGPNDACDERDEGSGNSCGDSSSEDELMSPTCVSEETISPVGLAKGVKTTNEEVEHLQQKHREQATRNGPESGGEAGMAAGKVNGHDPELASNSCKDSGSTTAPTGGGDKKRQSWNLTGNCAQKTTGASH